MLSVATNGSSNVSVTANGTVSLATAVAANTSYTVTLATQPSSPAQVCSVTNGRGTISNANITNVAVSCAPPVYSIAADVSGLTTPGLILIAYVTGLPSSQIPVGANGTTTLETGIAANLQYSIDIYQDPLSPLQICSVAKGNGTTGSGSTGSANQITVAVTCVPAYSVSATISGLSGEGLSLSMTINSATVGAYDIGQNGVITLSATLVSGNSYAINVASQPRLPTQTCTVANGAGVITNASVTAQVTCSPQGFAISGNAFGLSGSGLVLQLNGGSNLPVTENGFLTFPMGLPTGTAYAVTVASQPSAPAQTCTVNNGQGTVSTANISDLQLLCVTPANGNGGVAGPTQNAYLIGTPSSANSDVLVFPSNAGGTLNPVSTLTPINASDAYLSVATDSAGNIYVGTVSSVSGQNSNPRILVFSPGSSGAATPVNTLQLTGTPDAIAVDGAGNIYASSRQTDSTDEYTVGASGNASPTRSLAESCDQIVVDLNANLLCASDGGGTVAVFGPTQSGNDAPVRTISPAMSYIPYGADGDDYPRIVGLAVDASGDIFIGVPPFGNLPVATVFKAAGGTTSNDQGSPVTSVTASLKDANFQALQADAAGDLYLLEPALSNESILWRFAPENGDFAAPTSEGLSAVVGGAIAVH